MIKDKIKEFLENLSEDEIKNIPIAKKLEIIYNYPEIKLTKKGNLPIKIVEELASSGLFIKKPQNLKEDTIFEVKLFKNLLIASRLFRKSKNKLLLTKKYQNLSLKDKVLKLIDVLEMRIVSDTVLFMDWWGIDKDYFVFINNIDKFFYNALNNKEKEKIVLAIFYEFGILKDDRVLIEFI